MAILGDEKIIDCANADAWEKWLRRHGARPSGVWLKIAKMGSGKTSVTISDALDVALCYGWIDSQRRRCDASYYLQRYSPRRPQSPWSKLNVERAEALIAAGRMQPAGLLEIEAAKRDGRWDAAYAPQRDFSIPADFEAALVQNKAAIDAFTQLDKTGQYAIILPILKATTSEQRMVRVRKAIAELEVRDQKSKTQSPRR
jgi:uncharacterized protein YdeI (YjbR/CyaY-like superfamily)